jgi:predicted Co/Zn/Cd cation transporter (cation efflux family)
MPVLEHAAKVDRENRTAMALVVIVGFTADSLQNERMAWVTHHTDLSVLVLLQHLARPLPTNRAITLIQNL